MKIMVNGGFVGCPGTLLESPTRKSRHIPYDRAPTLPLIATIRDVGKFEPHAMTIRQ